MEVGTPFQQSVASASERHVTAVPECNGTKGRTPRTLSVAEQEHDTDTLITSVCMGYAVLTGQLSWVAVASIENYQGTWVSCWL